MRRLVVRAVARRRQREMNDVGLARQRLPYCRAVRARAWPCSQAAVRALGPKGHNPRVLAAVEQRDRRRRLERAERFERGLERCLGAR